MSASWPSGKKTFTQIVDGVTYMEAVNVNTVYDEVEAIQTYLGASGEPQAKNAALTSLFRDMFKISPTLTWQDADTIQIEATQAAMFSGNDYVIKRNTETLDIELSADLDTGAEANSTLYDIFLVGDGSGSEYTANFVVNGNTPDGATYYKKIGEVFNNADGDLEANSLQGANQTSKFGTWETKVHSTVYLAQTDGFVLAYTSDSGVLGYTDSNTPPTTMRTQNVDVHDGICMPVRKGDYWEVEENTGTPVVFWIANGVLS